MQRGRLEWLAWGTGGLALATLLTWPLVRAPRTTVAQDLGDPLAQAWTLSWGGHALVTAPRDLWNGNVFFPAADSYAYTDSLLGYAPAALLGDGPAAAVLRYNLVLLLAYALAFAAAALLARELGCRPAAAAVAGAAYAWAPWRVTHNGHLNVLSTGGVALALFLLVSGYRRGRRWQVLAGWLVAAWQLTLGFALGIWFAYLLLVLALVAAVVWWRRGRPELPSTLLGVTAAGGGVVLVTAALMARPYLRIIGRDGGAIRGREEVEFFSPPLRSLLAAGSENRLWGEATAFVREGLPWTPEQALFPGVLVVVLAALGLRWSGAPRSVRIGLFVGTGFVLLLSFGFGLWGGLLYAPFYEHAPGWDGLRTPGRLAFLWTLGLALLAAMGAQRVGEAVRTRWRADLPLPAATAAGTVLALLAAAVTYEGAPRLPVVPVPTAPASVAQVGDPLLHLPSDPIADTAYMLWSTDGFPDVVNGSSGYTPPVLTQVRAGTAGFPDAASVALLQSLGVRSVVVHRDRLPGTPWDGAADRPVDGLGITRDDRGDVVLFELSP